MYFYGVERLVEGEPDCFRPWHKSIPLSRSEKKSFSTGDPDTCNCAFCFKLVVHPALPRDPFDERYCLFVFTIYPRSAWIACCVHTYLRYLLPSIKYKYVLPSDTLDANHGTGTAHMASDVS